MADIYFNSKEVADSTRTVLGTDATGAFMVPVSAVVPGSSGQLYLKINTQVIPAGAVNANFVFTIRNPGDFNFSPPAAGVGGIIITLTGNNVLSFSNVPVNDGIDVFLAFKLINFKSPALSLPADIKITVIDPADAAAALTSSSIFIVIN